MIREKRATFSLAPGQPSRPGTRTPIKGLVLAGDWIDTGLPGTIESAVVSGHQAADVLRSSKSAIVHYQEIALKGKNRPWFVAKLVRNIREALSDLGVRQVRALMGRIEVVLGPARGLADRPRRLSPRLRDRQFRARGRVPLDIDAIARTDSQRSRCDRIRRRSACRRGVPTSGFR